MAKYTLVNNVYIDGGVKPAGSTVELDEKDARLLVERGSLVPEGAEVPADLTPFQQAEATPNEEAKLVDEARAENAKVEALRNGSADEGEAESANPLPADSASEQSPENSVQPVETVSNQEQPTEPVPTPAETPKPPKAAPTAQQIAEDLAAAGEGSAPSTNISIS